MEGDRIANYIRGDKGWDEWVTDVAPGWLRGPAARVNVTRRQLGAGAMGAPALWLAWVRCVRGSLCLIPWGCWVRAHWRGEQQ